MYLLQLYEDDAAPDPVEARLLDTGTLLIGRDTEADWTIADPDCALSRRHCRLTVRPGGLTLEALGANGMIDEASGDRVPQDCPLVVATPAAWRFGRFRLVATRAPLSQAEDGDANRTLVALPPLDATQPVPADWHDAAPVAPMGQGSLLEAFCEGAGLDASLLSSEEPEEIMRRAGALYRQMVLGVGDLMAERDRTRARYSLARTTIGGANNNPFKWAPSQRLAIDLLLAGPSSFLSGPTALKASFEDVKRHLVASFAGLQASLRAGIAAFDPAALEARRGLFMGRDAGLRETIVQRHAALAAEVEGGPPGALDRAFVEGYDQAERDLGRTRR
jgi:predicted component of type VI protein secretion system